MIDFKKLLLLYIIILAISSSVKSQNPDIDSIKLNLKDTILLDSVKGSFENKLEADTLKQDTVSIHNAEGDSLVNEQSVTQDTLTNDRIDERLTYQEFIEILEDSVLFDKPDSIDYVIYNLKKILKDSTISLKDSTGQAIDILLKYYKSAEIKPVITYLENTIDKSEYYYAASDSVYHDSIVNTIKYLLNSIPEDSLSLHFINQLQDTVLFEASESGQDSIHFRLIDNRGEYAILWIKKSGEGRFNVFLEDGYYLEKAKQKKIVRQEIDDEFKIPGLKKVEKVNMIIPSWKFNGLTDIKFNQGYVSESWAEGGENSMSALAGFKFSADYTYGKLRNLDTDLEYRLGYLKTGQNSLRKNDDRFELNAKYGRSAIKNWYYSFLLNFKTQFLEGKEYSKDTTVAVSNFLSPAYLVFSMGLDYKPSKKLTVLISPVTSKFTIVADTVSYDQTRFGVGENEKVRKEIGAYVKAISKINFGKNVLLINKVNFFTNYTNNPQNVDVDWEADLSVRLTDYIKMTVNTHLIYDDDVEIPVFEDGKKVGFTKKIQFKELFGIGFVYNF